MRKSRLLCALFGCGVLVAAAGCGSSSGVAAVPSSSSSSVTHPAAGSTGIVGEYFSLADEQSGDGVAWKDRLRPTTPLDKLTRLYVFGGWLAADKSGKFTLQLQFPYEEPRMAELLKAAREKNPKAQLLIVSGYDSEGQMYRDALKDPKYFADSVVSFIRNNKLDGYDMDWENGLDKNDLNALASAVRSALVDAGKVDGKRYLFTMAVWPRPCKQYDRYFHEHECYDLPQLSKLLDQIAIMSYGSDDPLPGDAEAYVHGGFPASKIMGGVETEGDYSPAPDSLGPKGTIAEKSAYARSKGLAGMMAWRLDNDYDEAKPVKQPTYRGAEQLWTSMTGK